MPSVERRLLERDGGSLFHQEKGDADGVARVSNRLTVL
jgi:hypothetical protein